MPVTATRETVGSLRTFRPDPRLLHSAMSKVAVIGRTACPDCVRTPRPAPPSTTTLVGVALHRATLEGI